MFNKKKAQATLDEMRDTKIGGQGNILSQGAKLGGDCTFSGPTSIAATIEGNVTCDDLLIIQNGGSVTGDITAPVVIVHGVAIGKIYASEGLEASKNSTVSGTVLAPSVEIEQGAKVSADLKISPEATTQASSTAA
ncbi:MAG: bactofilin family protein [Hyphomonas sp.]